MRLQGIWVSAKVTCTNLQRESRYHTISRWAKCAISTVASWRRGYKATVWQPQPRFQTEQWHIARKGVHDEAN